MPTSFTGRDTGSGKPIRVHCNNGRIVAVEDGPDEESIWIAPGLVDLQVNGHRGHDFNADDLSVESVQSLVRSLISDGVTTFLPTIITSPEEKIIRNLRIIAAAREADALTAHAIPFVHVEGPHISSEDGPRGAHPREHVRPPDIAEFMRWQEASGNLVGMVTLSPHYAEAQEYIRVLAASGIHVSLGHTGASGTQIRSAVDVGARLSTHLGNGVAQMLPRHPNLIWAQLAEDRLTATFIADGRHLPADTLTAMLRAKTMQRSILVSDLVALAGLPPGDYATPVGGAVTLHPDGTLNVAGTSYLAGATAPLKDGIAHIAVNTAFGLGDAIQMATSNPGRFTGKRGQLRAGADADLVRFRWEPGSSTLAMEEVVILGEAWQPEMIE